MMEQLGSSLADDPRLGEAEEALRKTLRMCAASPVGRSGTGLFAEIGEPSPHERAHAEVIARRIAAHRTPQAS